MIQRNADGDEYHPSSYRLSELPESHPHLSTWICLGFILILVVVAGWKGLA